MRHGFLPLGRYSLPVRNSAFRSTSQNLAKTLATPQSPVNRESEKVGDSCKSSQALRFPRVAELSGWPVGLTGPLLYVILLAVTASAPAEAESRPGSHSPAPSSPGEDRTTARPATKPQSAAERRSGYIGVVYAHQTAELRPEVTGVIKRCWVRLGERVKAGQIIVSLDTRALERDLAINEAALVAARAQETKATVEFEKARQILSRRKDVAWALSNEELEGLIAAEKLAQANLEVARSERGEQEVRVQKVRDDLAKGEIRAPFPGRIATLYQTEGALITSTAPVVRLVADDELWIRFAIPPNEVAWARPGSRAEVVLEDGSVRIAAQLQHIAPEVDPAAGLIFAEARLELAAGERSGVRPGMVARVRPWTHD